MATPTVDHICTDHGYVYTPPSPTPSPTPEIPKVPYAEKLRSVIGASVTERVCAPF